MTELVPGTVDAAVEKHLPEYTVKTGLSPYMSAPWSIR